MKNGIWSEEEHDRFLVAIKAYPSGPWSAIAEYVGTRSVRQVQTHTQKYYEKIMRRMRGIRKDRKTWARLEHRIEDDILEFCKMMHGARITSGSPNGSTNSSRAASPTQVSMISHVNPLSPVIKAEQIDTRTATTFEDDNEYDGFLDLPSLEESLDFFIASLEYDALLP